VVVGAATDIHIERPIESLCVSSRGVMMIQIATWLNASSRPRTPWNELTKRIIRLTRSPSLGSTTTCARRRRQSFRIGRSKNRTRSRKYGTHCERVQAPGRHDITRRTNTLTPSITKSWTTAPTTRRTFPLPSRVETRRRRTSTNASRIDQPVKYICTQHHPLRTSRATPTEPETRPRPRAQRLHLTNASRDRSSRHTRSSRTRRPRPRARDREFTRAITSGDLAPSIRARRRVHWSTNS